MDVLPTSAFACIIWLNAPVAYAWVIYPPDIIDKAPPMTFAAFPTAFPLAGNTLESALSNIPPTVVEFPLDADVALATAPNAVHVFPRTFPRASPIVDNNPLSCFYPWSPEGLWSDC